MTSLSSTPGGNLSDAIAKVESQLSALWEPVLGQPPRTRASTMNLVVFAEKSAPNLLADIDALAETHPARTLVFAPSEGLAPSAIDADVRAICREDPGGAVICSERVVLGLGEDACKRALSIVAALSLADLPTVVLALTDAHFCALDALVEAADRTILDSRAIPLERMEALVSQAPGYVADLGWIELFPFRDLTARAFDDPAWLPMLQALETIEVRHAALEDGKAAPDARLYVGWLASRIGATLIGPERARLGEHEIAIRLVAEAASPHGVGSILGVSFGGKVDGEERRVRIERLPQDSGFACSLEGHGETVEHRFRLIARDERWLFARALDASEPDHVLRDSIRMAAGWRE